MQLGARETKNCYLLSTLYGYVDIVRTLATISVIIEQRSKNLYHVYSQPLADLGQTTVFQFQHPYASAPLMLSSVCAQPLRLLDLGNKENKVH
jgi:hypothetical protein